MPVDFNALPHSRATEGTVPDELLPEVGPPQAENGVSCFMPMWKKIAIVVVAWVVSVLIYVEFFSSKAR